ncbi:Conserved_hypothetical protein [Hexamita inflata]|uniref:Leucine rich repeat protein n=1 Tax=Hexamita inflata TaxID=28002 RepID=A0AA86UKX0_9EUKA|nr:Conserved hypothetical protein [Hexamita inflata]
MMRQLQFLSVSGNIIKEIQELRYLVKLVNLDVSYNMIEDIQYLKALVNLESLSLSNNKISSVSNLQTLTLLTYLNISNNKIPDIQPLQQLVNLRNLYVSNIVIGDIYVLQNMRKLNVLDISFNKIVDIYFLIYFRDLKSFRFNDNQIVRCPPLSLDFIQMDNNFLANQTNQSIPTQIQLLFANKLYFINDYIYLLIQIRIKRTKLDLKIKSLRQITRKYQTSAEITHLRFSERVLAEMNAWSEIQSSCQ